MTFRRIALIGLVLIIGIAGFMSTYTVHQREQALILEFGKVIKLETRPGLHFKLPWRSVRYFDRRVLDYDAQPQEIPTRDQKQLVVDAFARYRIVDPLLYFQTLQGSEVIAQNRLSSLMNAAMRAVIAEVELSTLLTDQRAPLVADIAERVRQQARDQGLEVVDVRLRRVDLPEENRQAILERMESQRRQEAELIRAEGDREARRIRADADRDARIIVAEAQRQSEILRGEGEGEAQRIYNEAFGRDRDFFDFWISMRELRTSLQSENTRFIGRPEGDFFRFFGNMFGADTQDAQGNQ
jgi:membrane protease subunit HflC